MQADTIKLWFTYITALIIVVGGGAMLWFSRLDPPETSTQLQLLLAGFIGGAIAFLFNKESSTSTARQVERAIAAGAASQPTVTTGGYPPTTTVTPSEGTGP